MPKRLTKENPSRKTRREVNATDNQVSKEEHLERLYYKDYLVIGINQVTKELEKGPLLLVMVRKLLQFFFRMVFCFHSFEESVDQEMKIN